MGKMVDICPKEYKDRSIKVRYRYTFLFEKVAEGVPGRTE